MWTLRPYPLHSYYRGYKIRGMGSWREGNLKMFAFFWWRRWKKLKGLTKIGKSVLSSATHIVERKISALALRTYSCEIDFRPKQNCSNLTIFLIHIYFTHIVLIQVNINTIMFFFNYVVTTNMTQIRPFLYCYYLI